MEYRSLGASGPPVGVIGIGCMTFGWRADAAEAYKIVTDALDIGVNLFDTSVSYGRGVSEVMLGNALKRSGRRHEALIATKFGQAATADAQPHELGNGRRTVVAHCELSLRRLQVERIDLLQVHDFSATAPLEETLSALDRLVREGKVRHIGCSNFNGSQLLEALSTGDRRGLCTIASHQSRFNLLDRRAEAGVMHVARRHGVANLCYGPLCEGLLTGKYDVQKPFPADSRFAVAASANRYAARLTTPVNQAIQALRAAADRGGLPLWQLALAWVVQHPLVSCALVGPSTHGQVRALGALSDIRLPGALAELADQVNAPGTALFP